MQRDDKPSKFPNSFSNFIGKQWNKVKHSNTNLDRMLEEEYETLLREIDYLTCCEKSCLLRFKNHNFNHKSSEDLSSVLNRHSQEVLKTYAENNRKEAKKKSFSSMNSLVNYVTEIVVSRPKCNGNVCRCGEGATTAARANSRNVGEVSTNKGVKKEQASGPNYNKQTVDSSSQSKKSRGAPNQSQTQTLGGATNQSQTLGGATNQSKTSDDHSKGGHGTSGFVDIQTEKKTQNSEAQTDYWDHDPNCLCGCCPKSTAQITTNVASVGSTKPHLQDASTSDKKITSTKLISANCTGDTMDAITSTKRVCLQEDFSPTDKIAMCNLDKKDCACEVYDAKEAVKRGLVLPGSEACIQTKKELKSGDGDNDKKVKSRKKNSQSSSDSSESSETKKRKQKNKNGCFGRKKKRGCDEYCQGLVLHERSIQTLNRTTMDKNEEALFQKHKKTADTSTDSDAGVQVSSRHINESYNRALRMDKETSYYEDKGVDGKRSVMSSKGVKKGNEESGDYQEDMAKSGSKAERDQENKEKLSLCNRCGRQKRECSSGCRNTYIIPYASSSSRAIPAGDSESLRMLIKMQSKDTNRQIDTIMTEINHQKTEIRRLNDMYQKVVETVYQTQKSLSSYNQSNDSQNYSGQRSDGSKSCGCSHSNECKMDHKRKKSLAAVKANVDLNANIVSHSAPVKRYGPANTAVAINMCDTCTVEIAANNTRSCPQKLPSPCREHDFFGGDKEHKEHINQCKKTGQNLLLKLENVNCEGGDGFKSPHQPKQADSVSTIFKTTRKMSDHDFVAKEPVHIKESIEKIDIDVETDDDEEPRLGKPTGTYDKEPRLRKPKRTYSSRVMLWLKKSWVSIRHKHDECKMKHEETRKHAVKHMFDFCHSAAKHAADKAWDAAKKHKFFSKKE